MLYILPKRVCPRPFDNTLRSYGTRRKSRADIVLIQPPSPDLTPPNRFLLLVNCREPLATDAIGDGLRPAPDSSLAGWSRPGSFGRSQATEVLLNVRGGRPDWRSICAEVHVAHAFAPSSMGNLVETEITQTGKTWRRLCTNARKGFDPRSLSLRCTSPSPTRSGQGHREDRDVARNMIEKEAKNLSDTTIRVSWCD
jgi:hypothetical protein